MSEKTGQEKTNDVSMLQNAPPESPPPKYDDTFYRIKDHGISGHHHHHQTSSASAPATGAEASAPPSETPTPSTTFDSKRGQFHTTTANFQQVPEEPSVAPAVIIQQQPPVTVIKVVREEPNLEDTLAEGCCLCCTYCWARIACEICLQLLIGCARG